MSDSIGSVNSVGASSSTAASSQVNNNAQAEVQYYNTKAIGCSRPVATGDTGQSVPLGAAVVAYAGDPSSTAPAGTTRSALAAGNPYQAPPPPTGPAPTPAPAGNPWMAPPAAPTHQSSPAQASETSDADDPDAPKQPWHAQGSPTTYRDMDFDDRDDRPQDTWAPDAKRSAEFAALDTMKLTTPQEALAQWRAQKERAASTAPPATAMTPSAPMASAPRFTQAPVAMTPPIARPVQVASGNPWQAPHLNPATAMSNPAAAMSSGLTMPPPTSGPQLSAPPPAGPQAFGTSASIAPVDLSAGGYVNPNVTGPSTPHSSPVGSMAMPRPTYTPYPTTPNIPYLNQGFPGPQGMMNMNRYQAMASAGMPMGMMGMGGNMMGGGSSISSLLGDDPNPENQDASYGMLNLYGQQRNQFGPGNAMMMQMGGAGSGFGGF